MLQVLAAGAGGAAFPVAFKPSGIGILSESARPAPAGGTPEPEFHPGGGPGGGRGPPAAAAEGGLHMCAGCGP